MPWLWNSLSTFTTQQCNILPFSKHGSNFQLEMSRQHQSIRLIRSSPPIRAHLHQFKQCLLFLDPHPVSFCLLICRISFLPTSYITLQSPNDNQLSDLVSMTSCKAILHIQPLLSVLKHLETVNHSHFEGLRVMVISCFNTDMFRVLL